jgi:DNA-binding transcriptional ArsR family regulator
MSAVAQRSEQLWAAIGEPTRRRIVDLLLERGDASASALAAEMPVTRQAVAKHLAVLRDAGLVTPERAGRETRFSATTAPLADASRWLEVTGAAWDDRLARLSARLERRARDRDAPPGRE